MQLLAEDRLRLIAIVGQHGHARREGRARMRYLDDSAVARRHWLQVVQKGPLVHRTALLVVDHRVFSVV